MTSKRIVYLISRDKFTSGFISFTEAVFDRNHNTYVLRDTGFDLQLADSAEVIYLHSNMDFVRNKELRRKLIGSDKIIISGLFGIEKGFTCLYPNLLKKTYLHFWGGDFYGLRDRTTTFKGFLSEKIKEFCIKHCKAWITLIPGDYGELAKIVGKEKKHFVAPMPGDPRKKADFDKIMAETEPHKGCRIIIGNSATETNRHMEVFELLKHLKDEDIDVICPLSYGDMDYAAKVIEKGKEIFDDKFKPLTEYMDKDAYLRFLSTCDIGVFNQNRQQGMGNISMLFGLGKKVYMDTNTSMWTTFCDKGYKAFDVKALKDISVDELCKLSDEDRSENIRVQKSIHENRTNNARKRWSEVLND